MSEEGGAAHVSRLQVRSSHARKLKPTLLDTSAPSTWAAESDTAGKFIPHCVRHFVMLKWSKALPEKTDAGGQ